MKKTITVIALCTLIISTVLLTTYIYLFISKLLNNGLMVSINTDSFLSNWVFLGILIFSSILLIKRKENSIFYFQLAIIGLIIDFFCYKLIFNFNFFYSYFTGLLLLALLIFINTKKIRNENKWYKITIIGYVKIIVIDVFIVFSSALYYYFSYVNI